jgi:hypothetical protein
MSYHRTNEELIEFLDTPFDIHDDRFYYPRVFLKPKMYDYKVRGRDNLRAGLIILSNFVDYFKDDEILWYDHFTDELNYDFNNFMNQSVRQLGIIDLYLNHARNKLYTKKEIFEQFKIKPAIQKEIEFRGITFKIILPDVPKLSDDELIKLLDTSNKNGTRCYYPMIVSTEPLHRNYIHDHDSVRSNLALLGNCYGLNRDAEVVWCDRLTDEMNLEFTSFMNQTIARFGVIDLYYDEQRKNLLTEKEISEKFKIELRVYEKNTLFSKKIKYQNITFKIMDAEMISHVNFFKSIRERHLDFEIKSTCEPTTALLILTGFN